MTDDRRRMTDEQGTPIRPLSSVLCRPITGRLVIASHNAGKIAELREMLSPYNIDTVSAADLGLPEPEETGETFRDNARIKALAGAKSSGLPALADDSGLQVEALDCAPGVYSARWAGPDRNFRRAMEMIEQTLQERGATTAFQRMASFVSALCLAWPDGHVETFQDSCIGTIVWPPRGDLGFGYDPIFQPDGEHRTFGEMSSEEKHSLPPRGKGLSHRARAFLKLAEACLSFPPPHAGEGGARSAPGGGKS
jgi:XTP/dITP diphosphohydrolase